jgi:anion-transporting  ArsA/GET3 family ATPase
VSASPPTPVAAADGLSSPEAMIRSSSLVVCVGSGGVGKTTTAAALGVAGALRGRKVLVLTIDPARRLADALGLEAAGNEEHQIPVAGAEGELWALMLDTRSTFDDLIRRIAPDEETRKRILENRIYQILSDGFASSQDYMATEKLYDVVAGGHYDLVVLDTPPVKNALDFLEAPGRLARFLDKHIVKWFLAPYDESRVFGRLLVGTSGVIFRLLGVVFGREFLGELSNFFQIFRDMYDGFRERHESVLKLFADAKTAFVVVCAPNEPSTTVAEFFETELRKRKLRLVGFIVNQVHEATDQEVSAHDVLGEVAAGLDGDLPQHTRASLLARLEAAHRRLRSVRKQERPFLDRVANFGGPGIFHCLVPRLDEPIRDLAGLLLLERHLMGRANGI